MERAQHEQAGDAWGWRAADWATLMEPGNLAVFRDVLDAIEVGEGDRVVDIACGSGLAMAEAHRRGATVAGLDAAAGLVAVARERLPDADVHAGDMLALPWPDRSFDVATSFNGVWNVEGALAEMARVLAPGGRFGLSSWGDNDRNDLISVIGPAMVSLAPPEILSSSMELAASSEPGVFEDLCARQGLTVETRGATDTVWEFADVRQCARACLSTGPLWAAVEAAGEERVTTMLEDAAEAFRSPLTGIVRIRFQWSWVVGRCA